MSHAPSRAAKPTISPSTVGKPYRIPWKHDLAHPGVGFLVAVDLAHLPATSLVGKREKAR
jgi:hypothetical protein